MSNDLPPVLPLVSTAADAFVAERDAAADAFAAERETAEKLLAGRARIEAELAKVIVGQREVIEQIMLALLAGGHCLITGAPGLAKTLLVKSIAQVFHLEFRRIQFTPDLMPADITGTEILQDGEGGRKLTFVRGPVFGNMILADEINRTPPKTQAALLEAMQEHQVTAAGVRHVLAEPFFVLATQNPIEQEGTYPLPEAQVDRFMLKLRVGYPKRDEEKEIMRRMASGDAIPVQAVATPAQILAARKHVAALALDERIVDYIVDLVHATRAPADARLPELVPLIEFGASPRATIALAQSSRAHAFLRGRTFVTPDDVKAMAPDVLRHRVLLTYEAEAENVTSEQVIARVLDTVPAP